MCDNTDKQCFDGDLISIDGNQSQSISTDLPALASNTHLFGTLSPISLLGPISLLRINDQSTSTPFVATNRYDRQTLLIPSLIEHRFDETNDGNQTEQLLRTETASESSPVVAHTLHTDHDNTDELSHKVIQILGRTKPTLSDDSFDGESLGLIDVVINKSECEDSVLFGCRRSPDGNGNPFNDSQAQQSVSNNQIQVDIKLVHYSSSESDEESNCDERAANIDSSTSKHDNLAISNALTEMFDNTSIRYRSYSASSGTKLTKPGLHFIGSGGTYLKYKTANINKSRAATGTQTLRSFLSEQMQQTNNDSSSRNTSTTHSSAVELHKSANSTDGELNDTESRAEQLSDRIDLNMPLNNIQQFIYIPTGGRKNGDLVSSLHSSVVSNNAPLDRQLDVFKTSHSNTSTKSSSSDGHKENRPINKKLTKHINRSSNVQKAQSNSKEVKADLSLQHTNDQNGLSPKKSKQYMPHQAINERPSTHHERQFKHLVERQKNYLKCLQRELVRLEKMEKLFAKLRTSNKHDNQSNKQYGCCEHNRETTTPSMSSMSTNAYSDKPKVLSKRSSESPSLRISSSQSDATLNYFETIDNTRTSKSSFDSFNHNCCRHHKCHQHSPQPMNRRTNDNITNPKIIKQKPVKITKSSKAIQTSQSLLNLDKTIISGKNQNELIAPENDEKQPLSWFIPIAKKENNKQKTISTESQRSETCRVNKYETIPVSLQETFNRKCKTVRIKSQIRVNHINRNVEYRKRTADQRLLELIKDYERDKLAEKVIRINSIQSTFGLTSRRIFTHKEMREHTERIYVNLPEVKALKERKKREEKEKNQRILAQIYKYKLKHYALNGKVTFPLTHSCLYY